MRWGGWIRALVVSFDRVRIEVRDVDDATASWVLVEILPAAWKRQRDAALTTAP